MGIEELVKQRHEHPSQSVAQCTQIAGYGLSASSAWYQICTECHASISRDVFLPAELVIHSLLRFCSRSVRWSSLVGSFPDSCVSQITSLQRPVRLFEHSFCGVHFRLEARGSGDCDHGHTARSLRTNPGAFGRVALRHALGCSFLP